MIELFNIIVYIIGIIIVLVTFACCLFIWLCLFEHKCKILDFLESIYYIYNTKNIENLKEQKLEIEKSITRYPKFLKRKKIILFILNKKIKTLKI